MVDNTKELADQSFFVYATDVNTGKVTRLAIPTNVQIGLLGSPSELQLLGRFSISSKDFVTTPTNGGTISVSNHDTIVGVTVSTNPASGRVRVLLPPSPRDGQLHFVKDMTGTAGTYPIDILSEIGASIDQALLSTIDVASGVVALFWLTDRWHALIGPTVGGGGSATSATYLTVNNEASLTAERSILDSANIVSVDGGANSTFTFNLSQILGAGAGTFSNATVTADAFGRITAITAGVAISPGADPGVAYIVVANTSSLANERALAVGSGLTLADGGANSNLTLGINDNVLATVSGTVFTGPVKANAGLTGSIFTIPSGLSYLVAGNSVTITSSSNGQIVIASTAVSTNVTGTWRDPGNTFVTTGSVSIDTSNRTAAQIGTDVFFYVSGSAYQPSDSNRKVAVFGGDTRISGVLNLGNSSSIQLQGNINSLTSSIDFVNSTYKTLVSITDALTGSIFSVSDDVTGIPILDIFDTRTIRLSGNLYFGSGTITPRHFWVSGTKGIYGGTSEFIPVFDTDLRVSGTILVGTGTLAVDSNEVRWNSATKVYLSGSDLRFYDTNNPTGWTLSQLAASGSAGGSGGAGEVSASYVVLSLSSSLANERVLTAGTGIVIVDGGANSTVTVSANVSGTWMDMGNGQLMTTGSVSIDTSNRVMSAIGTDVFFYVSGSVGSPSGSNRKVSVFGGDVLVSGSVICSGGLSGSLQRTVDGLSYLVAGAFITITSGTNGQIVVASTPPPGGGDPAASYVVLGTTASLSNERVLTAGNGIIITDNGANNTVTISSILSASNNRVDPDTNDIIVWRLNEPSGTLIVNTGTSGSYADLTGSTQLVYGRAGIFDTAIDFRGYSSPTFASASSAVTPKNADISVSTWIYPYQFMTGVVVAKNLNTGPYDIASPVVMGITGSFGNPFFQIRSTGAANNLTVLHDSRSLDVYAWNHFGFTLSGSGASMVGRFYVNGDLIQSTTINGQIDYDAGGWWAVGGLPTEGDQSGDYKLNDIRIANTIRNDEWWRNVYIRGTRGTNYTTVLSGGAYQVTGTWRDPGNTFITTGSVSIDSENRAVSQVGTDVFFYVSGSTGTGSVSTPKRSVFGGDVYSSGSVYVHTASRWIDTARASRYSSLYLLNGSQNTELGSGSKFSIGMVNYDPNMFGYRGANKVYFRAIFAPSNASCVAYAELSDYSGFINLNSVPGPIGGTVLTASSQTLQQYQVDVTSVFQSITGSGVIESLIWITASGSNNENVCKAVSLDFEW